MSPPSRDAGDLVRAIASVARLAVRGDLEPGGGLADAVDVIAAACGADIVLVAALAPDGAGDTRVLAAAGGAAPGAQVDLPAPLPAAGDVQALGELAPRTRGTAAFGPDGVATGVHVGLGVVRGRLRVLAAYRHADTPFSPAEVAALQEAGGLLGDAFAETASAQGSADPAMARSVGLDLNDRVVQGLATAVYSLRAGNVEVAEDIAARTLEQARGLADDLLGEDPPTPVVGDLVRARSAPSLLPDHRAEPNGASDPSALVRVLIADDSRDIRFLLGTQLAADPAFEVVGEAVDGGQAVELARRLQPDVVILDLVMPVKDGFQVLAELQDEMPDTKVVVLSGLDAGRMGARAVAAGADTYLEKGSATRGLRDVLAEVFPEVGEMPAPATIGDEVGGPDQLAHELRTPLTVIQGFADTLLRQMDQVPSAMVREMVSGIARNARQMGGLIDVFADAHMIGSGALSLETEPVDLANVVRQTVGDLATVTAQHEVELHLPEHLEVVADPLRVRQVVTNLVSNAVKFSPPGTVVEIGLVDRGDHVALAVADRGPGIPAALRGQLFRPYARLGARSPGMGLGLFISRGVARAHGGRLEYEDRPGGGSLFRLVLPLVPEATHDASFRE